MEIRSARSVLKKLARSAELPGISHCANMDFDVLPDVPDYIGLASKPNVQLFSAWEVHNGEGPDHVAAFVTKRSAIPTGAVLFHFIAESQMLGTDGLSSRRRIRVTAVMSDNEELHDA